MTAFRIVLLGCVLTLLALLVINDLDVSFTPISNAKSFIVSFDYPNHPPRVVEQDITSVLENELSQLEELTRVYSKSRYGRGEIRLDFQEETDLAFREMELHMLLRRLKAKLPQELVMPRVIRSSHNNFDRSPLVIYEFTYHGDDVKANSWLNDFLIPRIAAIPNIEKVETNGNLLYAWKVKFDPDRLSKVGLTRQEVIQKLKNSYERKELGLVESNGHTKPIFVNPNLQHQDELESLDLESGLQISDVASVELIPDRIRRYQRINGQKAIFINCYAHEGSNRIQTADHINQYVLSLSSEIPQDYQLQLNYDNSDFLRTELKKTWSRAVLSVLVIMVFIFLSSFSWRYLLVLSSSIIVTLALTMIVSWLVNLSFHLYTIAGLTIAIGILVDNIIVLVDHLEKKGNISIIPAQLAAAITTIIALLVIWFLPREYRGDLDDFGLIIGITLITSILVAATFSPAISSLLNFTGSYQRRWSRTKSGNINSSIFLQRYFKFGVRYKKMALTLFILLFGTPVFLLPQKWEDQQWYNQTIGSESYMDHWKVHVDKWLGGTMRRFYKETFEKSGYRTPERTRLFISVTLPYGHTLSQMNEMIMKTEEYLSSFQEIDKFIASVYSGRYGVISIEFTEQAEKEGFPFLLKNNLIQRSIDWGGVTWNVYGIGKGYSNASNESLPGFQVTLKGYHYEKLEKIAEKLAAELLKHKRIQEVNINGQLDWNEESLPMYRFSPVPSQLVAKGYENTLHFLEQNSLQNYPSLYLSYQDQDFPVYIESKYAQELSLFSSLRTGNNQVPLQYFGNLKKEKTLNTLHKENRQYIRNVNFNYHGGHRFGSQFLDDVIAELNAELPPGFSMMRESWSLNNAQGKKIYQLIPLMMLGIFFISSIFLESIKKGLIVMLIIPFSFIGLFLVFGWGKFAFDQGGYAAFLMIGGLSVNALLYILSDYCQLLKRHEPYQAMALAISHKAWPILLTVISTCCGLLPFLIHGDSEVFWFSFAIGTIGGLLFSLIVVFWLMPILILPKRTIKTSIVSSKN